MQHYHNNRINPVLRDAQGTKSIWLLYRQKGLFRSSSKYVTNNQGKNVKNMKKKEKKERKKKHGN